MSSQNRPAVNHPDHPAIEYPAIEYPAIVLVPYGSFYPQALATYYRIQVAYEREFTGSPVRLAFTSRLMMERLNEKEGIVIQSPLAALAQLRDLGHRKAVVQSLQIVPGEEFHQMASLVKGLKDIGTKSGFDRLELGLPLLAGLEDCKRLSSLIPTFLRRGDTNGADRENLRDPESEAIVLVGHGTGHPADSLYSLMAGVLRKNHRNVFLGTLEGFPGISNVISELNASGAKRVKLMPFLLVWGGHATNDLAGRGPNSWKSLLEQNGFEVDALNEPLGEQEEIISIFLEHTRSALEKM
jgi:sirohydrochlorin cobaltochelatase